MRLLERALRTVFVLGVFRARREPRLTFRDQEGSGRARRGPRGDGAGAAKTPYDLTGLAAVNETLDLIRKNTSTRRA